MFTDFSSPLVSVKLRDELPIPIKKSLLNIERAQWAHHPKYHGKAEFFIHYHEGLLNTSSYILNTLVELLNGSNDPALHETKLKEIYRAGMSLINNAEHHHKIEDHLYFPEFKRLEPKLGAGIDLLENDHLALSAALGQFSISLNQSMIPGSSYSAWGLLYQSAIDVDRILNRHLNDEEEIIIPIFLRH
ncbi:MAG: hemerythrin domain-containing protein [Oceanospirillaceae bacterium]|nr:hemerythrin domain-containing protein [Oceanospirillaceae bacterium]